MKLAREKPTVKRMNPDTERKKLEAKKKMLGAGEKNKWAGMKSLMRSAEEERADVEYCDDVLDQIISILV